MEEVGVTAVVKGLTSFLSDLGKMDRGLKGLAPSGNLITSIFSTFGDVLSNVGREVLNIAEFALGQLLANAITFVVQKLQELIGATIQAGAEFQTMQLRLNRLNFNSIVQSGADYVDVMEAAKSATQEQLKWIQRLAVQTPYDAQDIANVFTLARSYGFADNEARGLTQDISDFAAGMGLGNVEIERIIVNFGQMVQQGKVTQREMNDLARGAFVPVNDILKQMGQNVSQLSKVELAALAKATGISADALKHLGDDTQAARDTMTEFRKKQESVNFFMQAFSDLVKNRFQGAAQDMARTFQGATANAQDFVKSLIGFGVVKPILDKIGGSLADLINSLTTTANWDALTTAAQKLGDSLSNVMGDILGLLPSADNLAQKIISGISGLSSWIDAHRGDIVGFFKGIGMTIQTRVVPFILKIVDSFNTIRDWVTKNSKLISSFFGTLGEIVRKVFSDLGGGNIKISGGLQGFLDAITGFMNYVIQNKDAIIPWVEGFIKLFAIIQVVGFVFGVLMSILIAIFSPILAIIGIVIGVIGVFNILGPIIVAVATFIVTVLLPAILIAIVVFLAIIGVIAAVVIAFDLFRQAVEFVRGVVEVFGPAVLAIFNALKEGVILAFETMALNIILKIIGIVNTVREKVEIIKDIFLDQPWGRIGREMLEGVARGVLQAVQGLIDAVVHAVEVAYQAALDAIGAQSPSKLFMNVGRYAMLGMAKGIENMSGMVADTMQNAMMEAAMPAMLLPAMTANFASAAPSVSNSTQNTNNYNLTINSNAPSEPIVQDYNMLKSLAAA